MIEDGYEMTDRLLCVPLFGADLLTQIRTALESKDYTTFETFVQETDQQTLEHVYPADYKTCLEIAASDPGKLKFLKVLLTKVNVNKLHEVRREAALHLAVENGNLDGLKALLEVDNIDINIKRKGNNTALLWAIKKIKTLKDNREHSLAVYEEIIKLLLQNGCDANTGDSKGVTPLQAAEEQGLEKIIKLLGEYSGSQNTVEIDTLVSYIYANEEDKFLRDFVWLVSRNQHHAVFTAYSGTNSLLDLATEKGLEKVVDILLRNGANSNGTKKDNTRPVAIACRNGYVNILRIFLNNQSTSLEPVNGESLLQITINGMRSHNLDDPKINHTECLKFLLNSNKIDVNHQNKVKNTPLHYAARNGDEDTVLLLLRKGAYIGLKNQFDVPPLTDIRAETLETYLNECITIIGKPNSNDDYEIHIDFSFLVHPNTLNQTCDGIGNEKGVETLIGNTENDKSNKIPVILQKALEYETEPLLYMAMNANLKHLLKHPVITSFLYLKWQRISCLFYTNIMFYFLFYLCLISHIFLGYSEEKETIDEMKTFYTLTRWGTIIGLIIIILRELFQFLVNPSSYIKSIENWIEIVLIIVTFYIVRYENVQESTKQQLSAVAILFSSVELILLVSHFPTLSTYIAMLTTVSKNFLKFLLWYCILIIAFALSFFTLFRTPVDIQIKPNTTCCTDNNTDFFADPGGSIFKTLIMLTGEFESGNINFDTIPWTSHILFIIFIFMVPIVLFNLLNGLAVSDIQVIRRDAEMVGQILLLETISYFECLFVTNIMEYPTSGFYCLSHIKYWYNSFLNIIKSKMLLIQPLAKRISLFPKFIPDYKIIIKPTDENKIEIPGSKHTDQCSCCWWCFKHCPIYRLKSDIIQNAKMCYQEKNSTNNRKANNIMEIEEIKKYFEDNKVRIEKLENMLRILCDHICIEVEKKDPM